MKKIALLGSTGSIGTQALEVIEEHSDKFEVEVLMRLYADYSNYMKKALELAAADKMGMLNSINAMKNFLYRISRGQFNQETWDKHKFMPVF